LNPWEYFTFPVERLGEFILVFAPLSFSFLQDYITLGRLWQEEIESLDGTVEHRIYSVGYKGL
jgi:hypothetical protein